MADIPWQWSEERWRSVVSSVRGGKSLAPRSWPDKATAAVAISFDSDHETGALSAERLSPADLSPGEYGARVGVRRILALLDSWSVPATFFCPAVSALLHSNEVHDYVRAGHEVALHGWIHERPSSLPPGAERELALKAVDALERLTGRRPEGMRTPYWEFSPQTLPILKELALLYDSSLMADDDPYEILEDGRPTGIVEIPVDWIRDDAPYLSMDTAGARRPYTAPRSVLGIWKDEFAGAYAEGGLFQLTCHPHIIGHRSRTAILGELLEFIAGHDNIWFGTHAQVARHVLQSGSDAMTTGKQRINEGLDHGS